MTIELSKSNTKRKIIKNKKCQTYKKKRSINKCQKKIRERTNRMRKEARNQKNTFKKTKGGASSQSMESMLSPVTAVVKEGNPFFRIGLEIETCFSGKTSKVIMGCSSCEFEGEDCSTNNPCPVKFLRTTHDHEKSKSLFKGVPELVSNCEKDSGACNVELIINPEKEIFYNGSELIDENSGSVMPDFIDSIKDWHEQGITACGAYKGLPINNQHNFPSTCAVHIHISAPFMTDYSNHIKQLYKILIFYLWYDTVQEVFGRENPKWIYGIEGTSKPWDDAPYKTKSDLDFDLPDLEEMSKMLGEPDKNIALIDTYYHKLPGANYDGSGDMKDRGTYASNIIIVNKDGGELYPHFEFRSHYDFKLTYPSDDYNLVYEEFKMYIDSVYYFLLAALNMVIQKQLIPLY